MKANKVISKKITGTVEVVLTEKAISKEKIQDPDIKAIYLISEAMKISTPRMRRANLDFVLSKYSIGLK